MCWRCPRHCCAQLLHSTVWNCLSGRAGWLFAQVDETSFYLNSCCTAAPEGTSKAYLHPLSLITSSREARPIDSSLLAWLCSWRFVVAVN
eukprot:COSAG04_NODE_3753_length_2558_cov_3.102074_4_plen_90_part_00